MSSQLDNTLTLRVTTLEDEGLPGVLMGEVLNSEIPFLTKYNVDLLTCAGSTLDELLADLKFTLEILK